MKVGVIAVGHFSTGTCAMRSFQNLTNMNEIWMKYEWNMIRNFPSVLGWGVYSLHVACSGSVLIDSFFALLLFPSSFLFVIVQTFHTSHQVPPDNRTLPLNQHYPDLPRGADCWPSRAENDYCACCGRTGFLVCFDDLCICWMCVCVRVCSQWKQTVCLEAKEKGQRLPIQANQLQYRNTVACPDVSDCVRKCNSQTDAPNFTL